MASPSGSGDAPGSSSSSSSSSSSAPILPLLPLPANLLFYEVVRKEVLLKKPGTSNEAMSKMAESIWNNGALDAKEREPFLAGERRGWERYHWMMEEATAGRWFAAEDNHKGKIRLQVMSGMDTEKERQEYEARVQAVMATEIRVPVATPRRQRVKKPAPAIRAYNYFSMEMQAKIYQEKSSPGVIMKISEVQTEVKNCWDSMGPEEKVKYVEKEEKDLRRYEQDMIVFGQKKGGGPQQQQQKHLLQKSAVTNVLGAGSVDKPQG